MTLTRTWAFDLGTKGGWAAHDSRTARIRSMPFSLRSGKAVHPGIRYLDLFKFCDGRAKAYGAPHEVYYEAIDFNPTKGLYSPQIYGGLRATLEMWCAHRNVPCIGLKSGQIKTHFGGKANAKKHKVQQALLYFGHTWATDDEADAIAVLRYGLDTRDAEQRFGS